MTWKIEKRQDFFGFFNDLNETILVKPEAFGVSQDGKNIKGTFNAKFDVRRNETMFNDDMMDPERFDLDYCDMCCHICRAYEYPFYVHDEIETAEWLNERLNEN